jgi:amidase
MTVPAAVRLTRDSVSYRYDPSLPSRAVVSSGATVVFETHDARAGVLLDRGPGSLFELPLPTPGQGNPLTGPLQVEGAEPGDALVVTIDQIVLDEAGWCGGHAHVGPLEPGRIPRPLGRVCSVHDDMARFSDAIALPTSPMIGCIGTAPEGGDPPLAGLPGRYGGNMDHKTVGPGASVYLPVFVPGGQLYVGDVHACQGDGELSGVALEIGSQVTATVSVCQDAGLRWPWVQAGDRIMVMTTAMEFADARREAVGEMLAALEDQLGLEPAEGLALISVAGDLRVGQAFGGMELTLRLEMPASLGLVPASHRVSNGGPGKPGTSA